MPPYSVLMCVYAGERPEFFRQAARSMVDQTVPPEEFVLVCDGPLPRNLEQEVATLAAELADRLRVLRLPERRGLGAALREGVLACRWEYIARMDSDDVAQPNRMELQLAALEADRTLSALGGQIEEFSGCKRLGCRVVPLEPEAVRRRAAFRNPMNHMTVTFRRQAVLEAGNYGDVDRFEDYHLWARMLARGQSLANLPQVLVRARVDKDTYARRGGWDYFCRSLAMERHLYACGLCSGPERLWNCVLRFFGTVLLPSGLRGWVYRRFFRTEGSR